MGKLAQRFRDAAKSGVYRVRDAGIPRIAAGEAHLAVLEVRLDGVPDKEALLQRFGAALAFPSWFGGNWDALEDCLTDLSWHAAAGYVLLLHGAGAFCARRAEDCGVMLDVLGAGAEYWRERGVPFFAVCVDPGGALQLPALHRGAQ